MSDSILPAGTYVHPVTGAPLTLGEWLSGPNGHERRWTHDPARPEDLAAIGWADGDGAAVTYALPPGTTYVEAVRLVALEAL